MKMKIYVNHDRWGNADMYEIVDRIPNGYVVWNIGVENMGTDTLIPLAEIDPAYEDKCHIKRNTLKAIPCDPETTRFIMRVVSRGINRHSADAKKARDLIRKMSVR